jgi:hypothetical protein
MLLCCIYAFAVYANTFLLLLLLLMICLVCLHCSIAVAAYPEVHTECWNSPHLPPSEQASQIDMDRLVAKVSTLYIAVLLLHVLEQ